MIKLKPYKNNWMSFYPSFDKFSLKFHLAGYFDSRPEIDICLGWGSLFIHLPFKTKYYECDPPKYGIYYHSSAFWFCLGREVKSFHMPYYYDWTRTSMLKKDGMWEHENKRNKKNFYEEKWNDVVWSESYPYMYFLKPRQEHKTFNGRRNVLLEKWYKENFRIQNVVATIKVSEREWRQRWLKWTKLFSKTIKCIEVDFSDEVGERRGSWKGGNYWL